MTNIESLLDSWKNNDLTPKERLRLLQLLEDKEQEHPFEDHWQQKWENTPLRRVEQPDVANRLETIRANIKTQILLDKEARRAKQLKLGASLVAGVILLLLGSWFLLEYRGKAVGDDGGLAKIEILETQVKRGEVLQQMALSDGSTVWLNVDTKLKYPTVFSDTIRQVWLEGEAYFDIVQDSLRPFVVSTEGLETRVLGTTFYVSSYPDFPTTVSLETGKVEVKDPQGQQAILAPDDQLIADPAAGQWEVRPVVVADMGTWKKGMLDFAQVPLVELVPILERWYGVQIRLESPLAKRCWIQGQPSNEPIWDLLNTFKDIHGITYEVDQEGLIYIKGGNCP